MYVYTRSILLYRSLKRFFFFFNLLFQDFVLHIFQNIQFSFFNLTEIWVCHRGGLGNNFLREFRVPRPCHLKKVARCGTNTPEIFPNSRKFCIPPQNFMTVCNSTCHFLLLNIYISKSKCRLYSLFLKKAQDLRIAGMPKKMKH